MKLTHSFVVGLEPEETFDLLLDVPRIAACMPGATLTDVDGEVFAGSVKVKLGPVVMTYDGRARILEKDRDGLQARIELAGRDRKGTSDATATVTTVLTPADNGTEVRLVTELAITGKPAQLGRGLMEDVGRKVIGQFATALAKDIEATRNPPETDGPADPAPTQAATGEARPVHSVTVEAEPIDLLEVAGLADKRLLAAGGLLVVLLLLLLRCRRRA